MPPLIEKYYKRWINSPTLFGSSDVVCFYRFVKACIRYGRIRRDGQWLRSYLEKDLPKKYENREYVEENIRKAVSLFDHFMWYYYYTTFPQPLLEMRQPFVVRTELQSILKADGSEKYSEEEIDGILGNNFGPNWEARWRARYSLPAKSQRFSKARNQS